MLCVYVGEAVKKQKKLKKKNRHHVKWGFLLGSLIVFLDTSPSFLCEALFLVKTPNEDCRLWGLHHPSGHVSPLCSAAIQVQELRMGEDNLCGVPWLSASFKCWKGEERCVDLQRVSQVFLALTIVERNCRAQITCWNPLSMTRIFLRMSLAWKKRVPAACIHYQDWFQLLGKRQET